jgi:hypothetical protein
MSKKGRKPRATVMEMKEREDDVLRILHNKVSASDTRLVWFTVPQVRACVPELTYNQVKQCLNRLVGSGMASEMLAPRSKRTMCYSSNLPDNRPAPGTMATQDTSIADEPPHMDVIVNHANKDYAISGYLEDDGTILVAIKPPLQQKSDTRDELLDCITRSVCAFMEGNMTLRQLKETNMKIMKEL